MKLIKNIKDDCSTSEKCDISSDYFRGSLLEPCEARDGEAGARRTPCSVFQKGLPERSAGGYAGTFIRLLNNFKKTQYEQRKRLPVIFKNTFLFLALLTTTAQAANNQIWTEGTAEVMPQGKYESGLFSPLRYGWKKDTELSTYALFDLLVPNIAIKKRWLNTLDGTLSSQHSLSYPSLLLDLLSKEGIGGILPATTSVPALLTLNNQLLYTFKAIPGSLWITPQIAVESTLGASMGAMPTIDFPLAYQATASYHSGTSFRIGVDMDGLIGNHWSYTLDVDFYDLGVLVKGAANQSIQHKAILRYHLSKQRTLLLGYKYVEGDYPFGSDSRFFPFADYLWQW